MLKIALSIGVFLLPTISLGIDLPPYPSPEQLLRKAFEEVEKSKEPENRDLYLRLARSLARFDKQKSVVLLNRVLEKTRALEDQIDRLNQLEELAFYAAPVDRGIAGKALRLLRESHWPGTGLHLQLKRIAIDLILARWDRRGNEEHYISKGLKLCESNPSFWSCHNGGSSKAAFWCFISYLDLDLGEELRSRFIPEDPMAAWESRFNRVRVSIHYDPKRAVSMLLELLKSAPSDTRRINIVAAILSAGDHEIGIKERKRIPPGTTPDMDELIRKIAEHDHELAFRLETMSQYNDRGSWTFHTICRIAARRHPEEVHPLLKRGASSAVLCEAARTYAERGEMEKARALVAAVPETDFVSTARMGEILGDPNLIRTALETALRSQRPFIGIDQVAGCAIRSLGCREAEVLLTTTMANLGIGWKDRWMISTVVTFATCDPQWALQRYKHLKEVAPEQIRPDIGSIVGSLFIHLAPEDPEFITREIMRFRKIKSNTVSDTTLRNIVTELAKRSPVQAKRFVEALGESYWYPLPFSLKLLVNQKRIADSPGEVNSILRDAEDLPPVWKSDVLHRAASDMLGLDNQWVAYRDIQGVTTLFNALEDHEAYGGSLAYICAILFDRKPHERDALQLLAGIRSAHHRAGGLEYMAWRKLHAQPWYPRSILGRWRKPDGR